MKAGQLRHRVTLQTATETQNTFGELTRTWATLATVWGSVEPLTGREFMDGRLVEAEISTRIRIRRRSDVTEANRVVWSEPGGTAHTFEVVAVIEDATHQREQQLMCTEIK